MFTFQEVTSSVSSRIPELIRGLDAFSREEPWARMRVEERTNALPEMVDLACSLAFSRSRDPALCRAVLEAAAHHGALRRQQGLSESVIFDELTIIRSALWADLQARYGPDCGAATEAIMEVDTILGLASQASLRGYFRQEFERVGAWHTTIETLALEWVNMRLSSESRGVRHPSRARRLMHHHRRRISRRRDHA